MRSELPKPLHRACGRTLLGWVVSALPSDLCTDVVIVVGHGRDRVVASLTEAFPGRTFGFAEQHAQRGTGDAAAVGMQQLDVEAPSFSDDDHVLVLPGDTPLLAEATVAAIVDHHVTTDAAVTMVTTVLDDPAGYGRVLRSRDGSVESIVEERDCSAEQRRIGEINGGMYCFRRSLLGPALRMISTDNAQGELYLTDAIGVLAEAGHTVEAFEVEPRQVAGVNDRAQLADAVGVLQARIHRQWMQAGVSIVQPSSTVVDADVEIGPDVTVHASTVIEGRTIVDAGAVIGPHTHLSNATVGSGAIVARAIVHDATIAADTVVEPFTLITGE